MINNKIQIATNEMIDYACKNYHYSKSVPCGRKVAYSVFENNKFIGCIIYSLGANNNLAKSFGFVQGEVVELTRVALTHHQNPVSRYVAITLKLLKKQCKTVKLVVSYADKENQGHAGGIYQAGNWIYLGISKCSDFQYFYKGHWTHNKTFCDMAVRKGKKYVQQLLLTLPKRKNSDKHKYIYCFDKNLDVEYRKLAKKYPKKDTDNACLVQEQNACVPVRDGGATPTDTHQDSQQ
jgi:hypothetical protein